MAFSMFGPNLKANILDDIEQFGLLSNVMRVVFIVVLVCHIPFIFFCAKENGERKPVAGEECSMRHMQLAVATQKRRQFVTMRFV